MRAITGFVAANPFGVNAFTGGPKSSVKVAPGDSLRLRFAVLVHQGPILLAAAYRDVVSELGESR